MGRKPARHRGAGAGREGRIEAIDVEGQIGGIAANRRSDLPGDLTGERRHGRDRRR